MSAFRFPILAGALFPAVLFGQNPPQQLTPPPLVPSHGDYVAALAALQGKQPAAAKNAHVQRNPTTPPPMITGAITETAAPRPLPRNLCRLPRRKPSRCELRTWRSLRVHHLPANTVGFCTRSAREFPPS